MYDLNFIDDFHKTSIALLCLMNEADVWCDSDYIARCWSAQNCLNSLCWQP
jgi:hypothetical protein